MKFIKPDTRHPFSVELVPKLRAGWGHKKTSCKRGRLGASKGGGEDLSLVLMWRPLIHDPQDRMEGTQIKHVAIGQWGEVSGYRAMERGWRWLHPTRGNVRWRNVTCGLRSKEQTNKV